MNVGIVIAKCYVMILLETNECCKALMETIN